MHDFFLACIIVVCLFSDNDIFYVNFSCIEFFFYNPNPHPFKFLMVRP